MNADQFISSLVDESAEIARDRKNKIDLIEKLVKEGDLSQLKPIIDEIIEYEQIIEAEIINERLPKDNDSIRPIISSLLIFLIRTDFDKYFAQLLSCIGSSGINLKMVSDLIDSMIAASKCSQALALIENYLQKDQSLCDVFLSRKVACLTYLGKRQEAITLTLKLNDANSTADQSRLMWAQSIETFFSINEIARYGSPKSESDFATETFTYSARPSTFDCLCIVSGKKHIDMMTYVSFPSLYRSDGFKDLLSKNRIFFNIYCKRKDIEILSTFLKVLQFHKIPYCVNSKLLDGEFPIYFYLALPIYNLISAAVHRQSCVLMTLPDTVFTNSIRRVIDLQVPGSLIAAPMPRVSLESARPWLTDELQLNDRPLSSSKLARLAFTKFIHPQTRIALKKQNRFLQYKLTESSIVARNFCPPPVSFRPTRHYLDIMAGAPLTGISSISSFYCVDHDFIDYAYQNKILQRITDSDSFFWIELTENDRHTDLTAGRRSDNYYYPESSVYNFNQSSIWWI